MKSGFPYLTEEDRFDFPSPDTASEEGIVAIGGNLSPGMLISAYSQGIFPWFSEGEPILWWSPDPRFVVFPSEIHVSASMRKLLKRGTFTFSLDARFRDVIVSCSRAIRPTRNGTWITGDMIEAYTTLHDLGYAHSVEAYFGGELAGGLYGVALGGSFFGESMFAAVPNASKAAFILLGEYLLNSGYTMIDSQVKTNHVESLGGRDIPRNTYLSILREALAVETRKGKWEIHGDAFVSI